MPEDLFIPVPKQTTTTELVGVTLKELSLVIADADSAGVLALVLAPLDENQKWRDDVQGVLVRVEDKITPDKDENGEDIPIPPQERSAATALHNMMFTAIVADTPEHQAMGVAGMTVWTAAKHIAPAFLPQPEAPSD